MEEKNFKVIEGGLSATPDISSREFRSAYVTNTRLMGVIGLYICWDLPNDPTYRKFHQFFYLDAEEYGFENYVSVFGTDADRISEVRGSMIGGLGGEQVAVSLSQACFILQEYVRYNKEHGLDMPKGFEEYSFLLTHTVKLSPPDLYILIKKQCVRLTNVYELINYFIMRCFGRDFTGASYLISGEIKLDLFPEFPPGTLCKNTVDETQEPGTYVNESLVECDDRYYIITSKVSVCGMEITGYERLSSFAVTPSEAAMKLSRPEFICLYDITDEQVITRKTTRLSMDAMITGHSSGDMFIIFNPDNSHVAKKNYRLDEDVLGLYYYTYSGQLISSAYSRANLHILERDISASDAGNFLIPIAKYEFNEPILSEFVHSGYDDFEDFIEAIKNS